MYLFFFNTDKFNVYPCLSGCIYINESRKVLLLVDNAGGHNISLELKHKLTNVELYFLPPNTTSVIQPCDQGIIQSFKVHYRKLLVEYLLEKVEKGEEYTPLTVSDPETSSNRHINS